MPFMVMVGAGLPNLVDDASAGLVIMMVGGLPIEGHMPSLRAHMFTTSANLAHTHGVVPPRVAEIVGQFRLREGLHK